MLNSSLLDKIASKHDAVDIVRMFHELHGNIAGSDFGNFYRMFLSSATEHNHTELRIILLADTLCNIPSVKDATLLSQVDGEPSTHFSVDELGLWAFEFSNRDQFNILKLLVSKIMQDKREG